jgi:RNA polymerase sigma factor (sigma-70 family)
MDVDDARLIETALRTPEAFGELFERHFDAVHRFCARRAGRGPAEDLAGETFRRAFESRFRYDLDQQNALPWLLGIAMNLVRGELRLQSTQNVAYLPLADLDGGVAPDAVGGLVAALAAREDLATIARLLASLPADDVEALLLHVWDGLSYAEVAIALGVPVGTVRSRLSRLRRRLGVLLAETNRGAQEPDTGTRGL